MKRGFGRREKCVGIMASQRKGKELLFWVRKERSLHVCFAAQEKNLNENE
jgi:hypothetical protein